MARGAEVFERVSPSASVDQRTLRPVALVALALALTCVVAVVLSGPQHTSPYALEEIGAMMPDPAEAVESASQTVDNVAPFHDSSDDPDGATHTPSPARCPVSPWQEQPSQPWAAGLSASLP